jgi:hypothetical protein
MRGDCCLTSSIDHQRGASYGNAYWSVITMYVLYLVAVAPLVLLIIFILAGLVALMCLLICAAYVTDMIVRSKSGQTDRALKAVSL